MPLWEWAMGHVSYSGWWIYLVSNHSPACWQLSLGGFRGREFDTSMICVLVCLGQIGGWYHRVTYRECFFEYEQVFVNKQPLRECNKILNTAHKRGSNGFLSKDMVSQLLHCIYRYTAKKTSCCYKARAIQLFFSFRRLFLNLHNINFMIFFWGGVYHNERTPKLSRNVACFEWRFPKALGDTRHIFRLLTSFCITTKGTSDKTGFVFMFT